MKPFLVIVTVLSLSVAAFAECDLKSKIEFAESRIFAPLKGSNATGGFARVKNNCAEDVELIFKSAEKFKAVESHVTVEEGGRMAMKKTDSFKIKSGETLELAPGGKHLMFFDPQATIKEGDVIDLTFMMNSKEIKVPFKIVPRMEKAHH